MSSPFKHKEVRGHCAVPTKVLKTPSDHPETALTIKVRSEPPLNVAQSASSESGHGHEKEPPSAKCSSCPTGQRDCHKEQHSRGGNFHRAAMLGSPSLRSRQGSSSDVITHRSSYRHQTVQNSNHQSHKKGFMHTW